MRRGKTCWQLPIPSVEGWIRTQHPQVGTLYEEPSEVYDTNTKGQEEKEASLRDKNKLFSPPIILAPFLRVSVESSCGIHYPI